MNQAILFSLALAAPSAQRRMFDDWRWNHNSETNTEHQRDTDRYENSGNGYFNSRDKSSDIWTDGSKENWGFDGPGWSTKGGQTSHSVRTGDRDKGYSSSLTGEKWHDDTHATWDNRKTETGHSSNPWGVDYREYDSHHTGSMSNEEWGHKDHTTGNSVWGNRQTHKDDKKTSDNYGYTDKYGNKYDKKTNTHNWTDNYAKEEKKRDKYGNLVHNSHSSLSSGDSHHTSTHTSNGNGSWSSSSSSSSSSSTKTSSSSSSYYHGRRRVADRLANAEDVEPTFGDYANEMLAPDAATGL